jgi:hypothetical protein
MAGLQFGARECDYEETRDWRLAAAELVTAARCPVRSKIYDCCRRVWARSHLLHGE